MAPYKDQVIDGSLEFVSDARELSTEFSREEPLTYQVRAEIGEMGLEFSKPYTGHELEVEAVLNAALEQQKMDRALDMCAPLRLLSPAPLTGKRMVDDVGYTIFET